MADAVVIGSGPNGLVAANLLADEGWEVVVLEAQPEPGGAVRSGEFLGAGWTADFCSSFYPLAAASPVLQGLRLEDHGLRWTHAPSVLAHPFLDGSCATLSRDVTQTARSLSAFATGDGEIWRSWFTRWTEMLPAVTGALFTPFPPVRSGARLVLSGGFQQALERARWATVPVRRLAEGSFHGAGAGALLAGCALHTDLAPEAAGSGAYGAFLAMLGQTFGFPAPQGGAGQLTAALTRRLHSRGGRLLCGQRVEQIAVRGGRAVSVRTQDRSEYDARRAVIADVDAPALYRNLVGLEHLPAGIARYLRLFQWDYATFKVDWALSAPLPWAAPETSSAGTVHIAADLDEMTMYTAQLAAGRVPRDPFLLVGQMTTCDPTRSPRGTEAAWAYTHVPREVRGDAGGEGIRGGWDEHDNNLLVERIETRLERWIPGFRDLIVERFVQSPRDLQGHDSNLVGGAINGGTAAIHQQLFFRPLPGLGAAEAR